MRCDVMRCDAMRCSLIDEKSKEETKVIKLLLLGMSVSACFGRPTLPVSLLCMCAVCAVSQVPVNQANQPFSNRCKFCTKKLLSSNWILPACPPPAQLRIIHVCCVRCSDIEINNFASVCRKNIIEAMQTLILGVQKFEMKWSNDVRQRTALHCTALHSMHPLSTPPLPSYRVSCVCVPVMVAN